MQASEEVVVEKIEIIGESVVYICSVDEELCPISQIEENAAEVKEGIVSTLASQTDPATQIFIKPAWRTIKILPTDISARIPGNNTM